MSREEKKDRYKPSIQRMNDLFGKPHKTACPKSGASSPIVLFPQVPAEKIPAYRNFSDLYSRKFLLRKFRQAGIFPIPTQWSRSAWVSGRKRRD